MIDHSSPNGLAQRQRRDQRDSSHYRATFGKMRLRASGAAAVRCSRCWAAYFVAGKNQTPAIAMLD